MPNNSYLYLRSREAQYTKLRHEIVKVVSYQIGEGRSLSTFEIKAVIDSKLRENRLKSNSITINEVVEDLVAETIASPMLESKRKAEIIDNLSRVHRNGSIIFAIERIGIPVPVLLKGIKESSELSKEDFGRIEQEMQITTDEIDSTGEKKIKEPIASRIFGILGALSTIIAGIIASLVDFSSIDKFLGILRTNEFSIYILLGAVASFIAAILTTFFSEYMGHSRKKLEMKSRGKE